VSPVFRGAPLKDGRLKLEIAAQNQARHTSKDYCGR
jgi:hypothetical protein